MCGRYALGIRATFVRHQLREHDMPVEDAPEDDDVRQTYNFAPGNRGLVYRADVPDHGAGRRRRGQETAAEEEERDHDDTPTEAEYPKETKYKLQAMKWGLVPFWTKRSPDYGTIMRTINARDDSLAQTGGMWNTMKQNKRCVVVAQGFYEWLKKNGGKEKIPHYIKRKDEQLVCFAGLWDCVRYEGSDEKLYTYTIITTDSNKQLSFLHDRMPVILENGSKSLRDWLDPKRSEWTKELQSLLRPFNGDLEYYPVSQEVGKVGNNSPSFIIPVASTENKNNIANFFANSTKEAAGKERKKEMKEEESDLSQKGVKVEHKVDERRGMGELSASKDNAPMPASASPPGKSGTKRAHEIDAETDGTLKSKAIKVEPSSPSETKATKKSRSATSNGTKGSPVKAGAGSQKITSFFNK